jgi:hypothetical protein
MEINMAIGKSGRVVIELDPKLKEELHKSIKMKGMNLKEWFAEKIAQDFPELLGKKSK